MGTLVSHEIKISRAHEVTFAEGSVLFVLGACFAMLAASSYSLGGCNQEFRVWGWGFGLRSLGARAEIVGSG